MIGIEPNHAGAVLRARRSWVRLLGCALTFAVLVWRLGASPFLNGFRTVDGGALAAAAGLAVLTTVCYAWRWKIVARGLGVDLSLPAAVAAYYRSMFINATLPGGIVGDVHRVASHGRDVLVAGARPDATRSAWARLLSGAAGDIRDGLLARRAWLDIALATALGVGCHVATWRR